MSKYTILEELYIAEKIMLENIPDSDEYPEIHSKLVDSDDSMREKLKNYPKNLLENYEQVNDIQDEFYAYAERHYFAEGIKFGFKLAMDILK